jgi:hypothetical protein
MGLFIVAAKVVTRWSYFWLQRSAGKYFQPLYEGHVLDYVSRVNPLNAELNPICHLPILLGDLTFMGKCIVSILEYC